jgi:flavin reductase (DIM6/NTAB) family NADH-FMN oxidoreductase RutF
MNETLFEEIKPTEIQGNTFQMIDKQWFLLTAGNLKNFNTMTASWGGLGILWNKPVVFCFVRPQRFTYQFMETSKQFTMSFLGAEHRSKLNYCGKYSGRNVNKIVSTGLISKETPGGSIYFEQADLVLECVKIYVSDLDPSHFLDPSILNNYPKKDYHRLFIGEIISCLQKSQ